jgi:pimeloyl-ACP methyl ester carboxylesterase
VWWTRVGLVVAIALLHGCAVQPATSSPNVVTSSVPGLRATPLRSAPEPSRHVASAGRQTATVDRVVAAAGVRQWVHCQGSGPLTLVVIPGLGSSADAWQPVLRTLEQVTRTCIYDRPGIGRSPARPDRSQIVDAGLYAGELKALLVAVHEVGPYVLLGHSFGGLIARAFVHRYGAAVRGLLLAESVTPGDPTIGPYWNEGGHRVAMARSSAATGGGPRMGALPLLVLSASHPEEDHLGGPTYGQPQWMVDLWRKEQLQDPSLSTNAIQVIAESGHVLQQDNPGATEEAARELVRAAGSGTPLGCSSTWRTLGATCR